MKMFNNVFININVEAAIYQQSVNRHNAALRGTRLKAIHYRFYFPTTIIACTYKHFIRVSSYPETCSLYFYCGMKLSHVNNYVF